MENKVTKVTFWNGEKCPIIGLGTWKLGETEDRKLPATIDVGKWSPDQSVVTRVIKDAIAAGYRHFDCAYLYRNEKEIGNALSAILAEGKVKRSDLFITSKLWCSHFRPDLVMRALKETLQNLQLDYLDLYLIHWPTGLKQGNDLFVLDEDGKVVCEGHMLYMETWKVFEKCVQMGLVKSIGVSNFNSKQIRNILDSCSIKPVVNQVECHPYLNQKKLKSFCESKGILLTAYCPIGSPNHQSDLHPLKDAKIKEIAEKYSVTPAQVLLRYQVQNGVIAIPKSINKSRLESNINIFDFVLSEEDMKDIDGLNINKRFVVPEWCAYSEDNPFAIEF